MSARHLALMAHRPPSLDLNFLAGVLDQRITFSRASVGTYFDAAGVMQTAASGAPRFDYDPVTLAPRGLLIEEARTNGLRNSTMAGLVNGVIGSGGAWPTNWWVSGTQMPVITVSESTESGISCIDTSFTGITAGSGFFTLQYESINQIAASNGQTWMQSQNLRIIAGDYTNFSAASFNTTPAFYNSTGTRLTTFTTLVTPTTAALAGQRYAGSGTASDPTTAFVKPALTISWNGAVALNLTIRIGAPQLEASAFATSYIPTTTGPVLRAGEQWTMPTGSWFNAAAGTLASEAALPQINTPANNLSWAGLDNGLRTDVLELRNQAATASVMAIVFSAGANKGSVAAGTIAANAPFKAAIAYDYAKGIVTLGVGGGAVAAFSPSAMPAALSVLGSGRRSDPPSGYLRRLRYWPRPLSTTELLQVTR